ncbi:MAG: DUF192 domain-containing protein [Bacilli bacterium]|nr:DUF192 domain-containing protein [Bacilli bacterium]
MKLIYQNKEITLKECKSFFERFTGFMLTKNINKALLFNHCNSIHTFFMYKNIDIIMCNKDNNILYYYKNLGKNKIILPKKGVSKVYETPANYFNNIKINNKLEVTK